MSTLEPTRPEVSGPEPAQYAAAVRQVVAAVMRLSSNHPDVDDGVSETMRRGLEGQGRLRPGEPLRPWLCGIARHVALDALRRRGKERLAVSTVETDSSSDVSIYDTLPDSSPGPLEQVETQRRVALVRQAMADLPEGMREALTMFHVEGLGYDAVAKRMNVPLGTVATWIARGRKTLLERMKVLERSRR